MFLTKSETPKKNESASRPFSAVWTGARRVPTIFSCYPHMPVFYNYLKYENKVGKPLLRLPPYQTVPALLRHTAYQYGALFTMIIKRMHSSHLHLLKSVRGVILLTFFFSPKDFSLSMSFGSFIHIK
jgi:hypothetical protein